MVRIAAHTKTNDLCVDFRAAFFRMLVLFQHDHTRAVAQHEAITLFIPRTACRLRVVIAGGQRARSAKAAYAQRRTRLLCATGNHRVGIAIGDNTCRVADIVYA